MKRSAAGSNAADFASRLVHSTTARPPQSSGERAISLRDVPMNLTLSEVNALPPDQQLRVRDKQIAIGSLPPDALVNFAVTYYTGLVDTVAHIPDRCYVADGFEPTSYTKENWPCFAGRSR